MTPSLLEFPYTVEQAWALAAEGARWRSSDGSREVVLERSESGLACQSLREGAVELGAAWSNTSGETDSDGEPVWRCERLWGRLGDRVAALGLPEARAGARALCLLGAAAMSLDHSEPSESPTVRRGARHG